MQVPNVVGGGDTGSVTADPPPPATRAQQRHEEEERFFTDEEAEPVLRGGTYMEACRAVHGVDCKGQQAKALLACYGLLGGIGLIIPGLVVQTAAGSVLLVMGTFCFLGSLLLIFFFYPNPNPVRVISRRFLVCIFCNRRWIGQFFDWIAQHRAHIAAVLGFVSTLTAVTLSSIVVNVQEARGKKAFVRATVAMWIVAFITCFPLGGGRRMREWFHERDA